MHTHYEQWQEQDRTTRFYTWSSWPSRLTEFPFHPQNRPLRGTSEELRGKTPPCWVYSPTDVGGNRVNVLDIEKTAANSPGWSRSRLEEIAKQDHLHLKHVPEGLRAEVAKILAE